MMPDSFQIRKVYYCDDEGVQVRFEVVSTNGELFDSFDSYTKAERKIVSIFESMARMSVDE